MPKLNGQDVSEREFYRYVEQTTTGELITEYPKMLYRAGSIAHGEHHHHGEKLLIAGAHDAETMVVANEDEELAALGDGWSPTIVEPKKEARRGNAA